MEQKKNRGLQGVIAFVALLAILIGVWQFTRPEAQAGEKTICVEVVHKDGSEKSIFYQTDHEYLGALLLEEGLISGTEGQFGLFVDTVDGETADYSVDGGWWQLLCEGEPAQTGVDSVVITDGAGYAWVYTVG